MRKLTLKKQTDILNEIRIDIPIIEMSNKEISEAFGISNGMVSMILSERMKNLDVKEGEITDNENSNYMKIANRMAVKLNWENEYQQRNINYKN